MRNRWTDQDAKHDEESAAKLANVKPDKRGVIPHFETLDDNDWLFSLAGNVIDKSRFSISMSTMPDFGGGNLAWFDRSPAARSVREVVTQHDGSRVPAWDRDLDDAFRARRDAAQIEALHEANLREWEADRKTFNEKAKVKADNRERRLEFAAKRAKIDMAAKAAPVVRTRWLSSVESIITPSNAVEMMETCFYPRVITGRDEVMFVVDERAGYFDLIFGAFPTNPTQVWRGLTNTGRRVAVRGTGETFYGWEVVERWRRNG